MNWIIEEKEYTKTHSQLAESQMWKSTVIPNLSELFFLVTSYYNQNRLKNDNSSSTNMIQQTRKLHKGPF